ncbi:unnamed protein product, partial [Mesorhabditis belari]|uniref:NF-X1-type domain-containing protein n=1 Tax=Mesorhabditis belari TaxID=2138241 RepID=A0AAF3F6S4_9BILA
MLAIGSSNAFYKVWISGFVSNTNATPFIPKSQPEEERHQGLISTDRKADRPTMLKDASEKVMQICKPVEMFLHSQLRPVNRQRYKERPNAGTTTRQRGTSNRQTPRTNPRGGRGEKQLQEVMGDKMTMEQNSSRTSFEDASLPKSSVTSFLIRAVELCKNRGPTSRHPCTDVSSSWSTVQVSGTSDKKVSCRLTGKWLSDGTATQKKVRHGFRDKQLNCGIHVCQSICHAGACEPCRVEVVATAIRKLAGPPNGCGSCLDSPERIINCSYGKIVNQIAFKGWSTQPAQIRFQHVKLYVGKFCIVNQRSSPSLSIPLP